MHRAYPRLLGDIGGTNSRWRWELSKGEYGRQFSYRTADFPGPEAMILEITRTHSPPLHDPLQRIGIAVATPVLGDSIQLTNANWHFSISELNKTLDVPIHVINDFVAQAYALARIPDADMTPIGPTQNAPRAVKVVLGPGTGLGVAQFIPLCTSTESCWRALPGEGGHSSFSPNSELDVALLQFAWRNRKHVSWERVLSGNGLELIYAFLADKNDAEIKSLSAAQITENKLQQPLCTEAMQYFSVLLGNAAANFALAMNARGGVYISGGVLQHFNDAFDQQRFRTAFEGKGRFEDWLKNIPTYLVTDPLAAFKGISYYLDQAA